MTAALQAGRVSAVDRRPLAPAGRLRLLADPAVLPPEVQVTLGPLLLRAGAGIGPDPFLRLYRPAPTVAFTGLDRLAAGYQSARQISTRYGFTPVVRAPGGRAVAYHEDSLCLEIVGNSPGAHTELGARFVAVADVFATVLRDFGLDARVGEVPHEYCPGQFSVNVSGTHKLVGSAQRITGHGWMLGASVVVRNPDPVRAVLTAVYRALEQPFDPDTVGVASSFISGVAGFRPRNARYRATSSSGVGKSESGFGSEVTPVSSSYSTNK